MKKRFSSLITVGIIFTISMSSAQDSSGVRLLSQIYDLWDCAYSLAIEGDYAYVATGSSGLKVVDISDPSDMSVVGTCRTLRAYYVAITEDYAYLDHSNGIGVIDISDPTQPWQVTLIDSTINPTCIAVQGRNMYVTFRSTEESGLRIYDISDPVNPDELATLDIQFASYVTVNGDHAFVTYLDSLHIIDVSNPRNPREIGICVAEGADRIDVEDGHAYLIGWRGMIIVDISDPTDPQQISTFRGFGGGVVDIKVAGNLAFVAIGVEENFGLEVVDVSDPSNPQRTGHIYTRDGAYALELIDDMAFITFGPYPEMGGSAGLRSFNISDIRQPELIGEYMPLGSIKDVAITEDLLYVALGPAGLSIVDVSDSTNPVEIGHINGYSTAVANVNDLVILGVGFGIVTVDVSNPRQPNIIGDLNLPGSTGDIAVLNSFAYIACSELWDQGDGGLFQVDISDPENPTRTWRSWGSSAIKVEIENQYIVFLEYYSGLRIIDSSTWRIGSSWRAGSYHRDISIMDDFILIQASHRDDRGNWMRGIFTINISEPEEPYEVGFIEMPGSVETFNRHAIVVGDRDITVLDYSDPSNPDQVGYYDGSGFESDLSVGPDGLIYAYNSSGIRIYDVSEALSVPLESGTIPSRFMLQPPHPNPFNSTTAITYGLPHPDYVSLKLYNLSGQLVSTMFEGYHRAGVHSTILTADKLSSGLYFVRLRASDQVFTQKVILIQ